MLHFYYKICYNHNEGDSVKKVVVFVIIFALIGAGILFHKMDKESILEGNEPKYVIKIVDEDKKEIKYLGLGYVLYRKYSNKPTEKMGDARELKFGLWFLGKDEIKYSN